MSGASCDPGPRNVSWDSPPMVWRQSGQELLNDSSHGRMQLQDSRNTEKQRQHKAQGRYYRQAA